MKVRYRIPATKNQGPFTIVGKSSMLETAYQNALWDYNSARAHDGKPSLLRFPAGTTREVLDGPEEKTK